MLETAQQEIKQNFRSLYSDYKNTIINVRLSHNTHETSGLKDGTQKVKMLNG